MPPPPFWKAAHASNDRLDSSASASHRRRSVPFLRGPKLAPTDEEEVGREGSFSSSFVSSPDGGDVARSNPTAPLNPTLSAVHQRILEIVGDPATTDPSKFPTRHDLKLPPTYRLHVDLGGEGHFTSHGVTCGFRTAVNVNARRTNSQLIGVPIPFLIPLVAWERNPPIPFADGTVDYVTVQSAPLTEHNVKEIVRVLAPGGRVGLWIDLNAPAENTKENGSSNGSSTNLDMARCLAEKLNSKIRCCYCLGPKESVEWRCCDDEECRDEFAGQYPFRKLCIANHRC